MTMSAYHGITLAVIAVVALGTAMYTYFSSRNRQQDYSYDPPPTDAYFPETERSESSRRRRKQSGTDKCTICFDSLRKTTVMALTCGHLFHAHCISMWLSTSKSCPICRSHV